MLWARGAALAALLLCAARAQADDAPAPPAPPVAKAPQPFVLPSEKSPEIGTHWNARREYLHDRDERRADDEVQRVRQLKEELALENLFSASGALVRESQDALAAGSPSVAVSRCRLAVELSPAMEEAHLCLARALLAENMGALKPAFAELTAAAQAAWSDPRLSRAFSANTFAVIFLGLLAAGAAFVLLVFLRYAMLYAHDFGHLFPRGARPWQMKMLAGVVLLLPVLLQMGPVPLIFTGLLSVALYLSRVEAIVSCAVLLLMAAAPYAAQGIASVAAFGGPAVDVWLLEHGEGSGAEIARLQRRAENGPNEFAPGFALAHKAKRDGDLPAAEKLFQHAIEAGASNPGLSAAHNDLGNVYLLEGETGKAIIQYQQAVDLKENAAAPHFNLSRAYGLGGVDTLDKVETEQSRAKELDRAGVEAFGGGQLQANRRINKFVMDMPLDDELLAPLLDSERRAAEPVGDEARAELSFGLPAGSSLILPLLCAAILLALHFARGKIQPSGRCERCGRPVCQRCDPEARPDENLCAQCVNVFIRRTGVEPAERIKKEYAVASYHRRRSVAARGSSILTGAGHVLLGYPLRGIVYLVIGCALAVSILLWHGVAHDPVAVRSRLSLFRVGLTLAAFIAVWAVCLRDLLGKQKTEEGY